MENNLEKIWTEEECFSCEHFREGKKVDHSHCYLGKRSILKHNGGDEACSSYERKKIIESFIQNIGTFSKKEQKILKRYVEKVI